MAYWAVETGETGIILDMLAPRTADYLALRRELQRWRNENAADWFLIHHEGEPLEEGDIGDALGGELVRALLFENLQAGLANRPHQHLGAGLARLPTGPE